MIQLFKVYNRYSRITLRDLFIVDDDDRKGTRGHCFKYSANRCAIVITKYFFSNEVTNRWNVSGVNIQLYSPITINSHK